MYWATLARSMPPRTMHWTRGDIHRLKSEAPVWAVDVEDTGWTPGPIPRSPTCRCCPLRDLSDLCPIGNRRIRAPCQTYVDQAAELTVTTPARLIGLDLDLALTLASRASTSGWSAMSAT